VDFVLERDGRLVGIEVKAGSDAGHRDTRGLVALREETGDRFSLGILLHGGTTAKILGDRLVALPAACAGK
jgi:predicted AAA+ superfamily ATPase